MVTYIATIGESIEAVVNTFWEFLLRCTSKKDTYGKYLPNTFIALASKTDYVRGIKGTEEKLPEVEKRIIEISRKILNKEIPFHNRIIDQESPESIVREMINIHEERRDTTYIVDVTGGRKTMSIGAALGAVKLCKMGAEVKILYFWLYNPRIGIGKLLPELAPSKDFELVEIDVSKLLMQL